MGTLRHSMTFRHNKSIISLAGLLFRYFARGWLAPHERYRYYVDVRDTARLHVFALTDPSCDGQRIFAFAAPFNRTDVLKGFRKLFPNRDFPVDRLVGQDFRFPMRMQKRF